MLYFRISDGNMEEEEEMAPVIRRPAAEPSLDFDELLRQAMNRKRWHTQHS